MNKIEDKIEKKLSRCLTVKALIEKLKTFPQDAYVGRVGNFGEFNEMSSSDFSIRKTYITDGSWRSKNKRDINCVDISTPSIEPVID